MTARALRDVQVGDVVDDYGTHRTVERVEAGRDDHGYPHVTLIYEDGHSLTHQASHTVKVVER
jgi:hypothetical protein